MGDGIGPWSSLPNTNRGAFLCCPQVAAVFPRNAPCKSSSQQCNAHIYDTSQASVWLTYHTLGPLCYLEGTIQRCLRAHTTGQVLCLARGASPHVITPWISFYKGLPQYLEHGGSPPQQQEFQGEHPQLCFLCPDDTKPEISRTVGPSAQRWRSSLSPTRRMGVHVC